MNQSDKDRIKELTDKVNRTPQEEQELRELNDKKGAE